MADPALDLDLIEDRAGKTSDWTLADPYGDGQPRPEYVRRHFEQDVPALLDELRAQRAKVS